MCRSQVETTDQTSQPQPCPRLGSIVCSIGPSLEEVSVGCQGRAIRADIDTGSSWCCCHVDGLKQIGEHVHNTLEPTRAMKDTFNASGDRMKAVGYFNAEFTFGNKSVIQPLVVFEGLKGFILSRQALLELGIVIINTNPRVASVKTAAEYQPPSAIAEDNVVIKPGPRSMKPLNQLTKQDLLNEYADVFAHRDEPLKGEPFRIELTSDAISHKVHFPRNIARPYMPKLEEEITKLKEAGFIEEVTWATEWISPIVVAPKKGTDSIRLCVDFRRLNQFCKREYFQSAGAIECVQFINSEEAGYFSKFDATKGFHQIELHEECRDLTTFLTPFGRFRFKRAPFGITSIPEHYNRRMSQALQDLKGITRFVDDTLVYGRDETEHLQNVRSFLDRCREQGIRLNQDKFLFKETTIEFAGLLVNKDGFQIHPKTVAAIKEFPVPTSVSDMRSFHGLANQLNPFDSEVAKKMEPLRHLLKSRDNKKFQMSADDIETFEKVKSFLSSPATLAYYQPGQPVQMYTDAACTKGYGFVLKQKQTSGTWRTIMVGSRSLIDAETRYAPIESELTALAWSLRKARKFLLGVPRFTVYTDHRPLVSLVNKRRLDEVSNTRLLRNLLKCADFNMEVVYIPGSTNVAADALSRHPTDEPDQQDKEEVEEVRFQVNAIRTTSLDQAECTLSLEKVKHAGSQDVEYLMLKDTIIHGFPESKKKLEEVLKPYWQVRENLTVSDDDYILYGTRLIIPHELRGHILSELHAGHRGIEGTKARARLVVYWPGIDNMIEQKCKSCRDCEKDRPTQRAEPQIHLSVPTQCFENISADFAEVDGQVFLVSTDWRSGWFSIDKVPSTNAKNTIQVLRNLFADTRVPKILFTDNGPPFSSSEFSDFCRRWGVRHITSSPYYAQSNTYAENGVKQAKALLKKCFAKGQLDGEKWTKGLPPAIMLYGHSVSDTIPAHKSALSKSWHKEMSDYDKMIAAERQKMDGYRKGRSLQALEEGTAVVVQNRQTKKWDRYGIVQEANKNIRKYVIRMPSGMITSRNRRDIRVRYPEKQCKGGTSQWNPISPTDVTQEETSPHVEVEQATPTHEDANETAVSGTDQPPTISESSAAEDTGTEAVVPSVNETQDPQERAVVESPARPVPRPRRTQKKPSYLKDYVVYNISNQDSGATLSKEGDGIYENIVFV